MTATKATYSRWQSARDDSDDDCWMHQGLGVADCDLESDSEADVSLVSPIDNKPANRGKHAEQFEAERLELEAACSAPGVEAMLQPDSREIAKLMPWVSQLHEATANLKAAVVSLEPAGAEKRKQLQDAYLKASNNLCHATVALCANNWWPQLFIAA